MTRRLIMTASMIMTALFLTGALAADDPVKWSAPMDHYPSQWAPSSPPPTYYNPYGYQYSYDPYGYGPSGGNWGYSGNYQGSQSQVQQGFSGNPHHYNPSR